MKTISIFELVEGKRYNKTDNPNCSYLRKNNKLFYYSKIDKQWIEIQHSCNLYDYYLEIEKKELTAEQIREAIERSRFIISGNFITNIIKELGFEE